MSVYLTPPFQQGLTSPLTPMMRRKPQGKRKEKKRKRQKGGGVEGTKDREKEKVTPQVHVGLPLCSPCAADGYASPTVPMGELTTLFIHLSSDTAGFNHGFSSERRS